MIHIKGENFFDTTETAKLLGLNVRTIHAYIRDNRLTAVKVGVKYYISENSVANFFGVTDPETPIEVSAKKEAKAQTIVETIELILKEYLEEMKLDRSPEAFRKFLTTKLKEAEAERDFWSERIQENI